MIGYENNCIGCDRCAHCGRDHEEITICDECGCPIEQNRNRTARKYSRVGYGAEEICEACAAQYADDTFNGYTLDEQLELFDWEREDFVTESKAAVEVSEAWYDLSDEEKCDKMVVNNELQEEYL